MNTSLSLKNPLWRKLVAEQAREYQDNGHLDEWIEANGFNEEVLAFIYETLHGISGDQRPSQDTEAQKTN